MNSKRPRRQPQATDNRIPVKVWILPAHLEKAEAICLRRNQSVSGLLAQLIRDDYTVIGNYMLVLLALGTYMDSDGAHARPGVERLTRDTGLAERTVKRWLAAALADGWLELVHRGHRRGNGTKVANEYAALLPPLRAT